MQYNTLSNILTNSCERAITSAFSRSGRRAKWNETKDVYKAPVVQRIDHLGPATARNQIQFQQKARFVGDGVHLVRLPVFAQVAHLGGLERAHGTAKHRRFDTILVNAVTTDTLK